MKRAFRHILKWFLPLLFIGYYSCISFYAHVHIEEGHLILHSHLLSDENKQAPHQHDSLEEIIFFHTLSSLDAGDGAIQQISIENRPRLLLATIFTQESHERTSVLSRNAIPRAPPIL